MEEWLITPPGLRNILDDDCNLVYIYEAPVSKKKKTLCRYTHLSMVPNQFQYPAETKFPQTQHTTVLLLTHGFLPVSMAILSISTQLMSTQLI